MVNNEIVKYLREGIKRGFAIELLKKKLLDGGFAKAEIEDATKQIQIPSVKIEKKSLDEHLISKKIESKPTITGEKLGLFGKIGKSIAHPTELFEKTRSEGVGSPLVYYLIISIFAVIIASLISAVFYSSIPVSITTFLEKYVSFVNPEGFVMSLLFTFIVFMVLFYVVGLISTFIFAGILQLFVLLYKGGGSYSDSYRAIIYGSTPLILLIFILPISLIWSIVLMIFGISVNHQVSKTRAFFMLVTFPLILLVIFGVVFAYLSFIA